MYFIGSLDEEVTHDKRVKVKDKTLKRKHSSGSFSEPVSLSSANRKAKTFMNNDHRGEKLFSQSSGHIDEKKMPEGQNKEVKKRRKNIDKQGLVNKRETEEDSNKFQNFKGTSSDESDSGTSTEQSICTTQKFTKVKANKVKTKHRDDTIKQSEKTTEKKNKMLSTKRHKPETVTFDTSESDSDQVNLESVSQQVKDNSCSDEMEPEDSLDEGEMESISNETQPVSQKLEKIFSDEKGKADSEENEEMDDEYVRFLEIECDVISLYLSLSLSLSLSHTQIVFVDKNIKISDLFLISRNRLLCYFSAEHYCCEHSLE